MLHIDRDQALAYRIAGHHLHERTDARTAIAATPLQQYPPDHGAALSLHARCDEPLPSRGTVTVNAMRGAPYVVLETDVRVFTTALVPDDEAELKALIGTNPAKEIDEAGMSVAAALQLVAEAARDGLAGGPLDRDAFHRALRERLPEPLLPWCRGCESHHVRPTVWRALGPLGVIRYDGRARWQLAGEPPRDALGLDEARRELVRRFLRVYGPGTHTHLASWAQTSPAYAKRLFAALDDELEPVKVEGRKAWVLAADVPALEDPPPARGVRLLHGYDPYVVQPDRDTLVPDKALRKQLFPAVGRPGIVLVDGALAGLWKARKKGRTLELEFVGAGGAPSGRAFEGEAQAVARLRGCERAVVL